MRKNLMALAVVALLGAAAAADAAPVTFHFDSGTFNSSPRAQSPRFGTHFTGDFTFSSDLDYSKLGQQDLGKATLLDWSATSGEFTLNSSNADLKTIDINDYFSASTGVPLVHVYFSAVRNIGDFPLSITAESGLNIVDGIAVNPAITCGPYNRVCGTNFRSFNKSGGSFSKTFDYNGGGGSGGSGGTGGSGGSGGGAGGGVAAGVPEPAAWTLMTVGFGSAGAMLRRRRATRIAV